MDCDIYEGTKCTGTRDMSSLHPRDGLVSILPASMMGSKVAISGSSPRRISVKLGWN
jgi:hypothetical protein